MVLERRAIYPRQPRQARPCCYQFHQPSDQVATLWPPIFALGNRIAFAYQTFPWANNAKDKAAVHVVIIGLEAAYLSDGLSPNSAQPKLYKLLDKEWHSQSVANISPYLIPGSNLAVAAREQPLCNVSKMVYGNKPVEGGNLILTTEEKDSLIAREPQSAKWIKNCSALTNFSTANNAGASG